MIRSALTLAVLASIASSCAGCVGADAEGDGSQDGKSNAGGNTSVSGGSDAAPTKGPDASGAEAGGGPIDGRMTSTPEPIDLGKFGSGLVLLLDPTRDVTAEGGKVPKWADQSGLGNHAIGETGRMPLLKTNAQGKPFVQFTGKPDPADTSGIGGPYLRIKDSASLNFGAGDFQIVFAAGYSNPLDKTHMGAPGAFVTKSSPTAEIVFAGNWPVSENPNVEKSFLFTSFGEREPPGFAGCDDSPIKPCEGLNDGKLRVYTLERVGDTMYMRWNGQRGGRKRAYAGATFDIKGDMLIGGLYVAGTANHGGTLVSKTIVHALKGDVYFVAVRKGSISDADLTAFENKLMTRLSIGK